MKIDVYDSYATKQNGQIMHFDVLVESNTPASQALSFGQQWLGSLGEQAQALTQSRCNFCHSEIANPKVRDEIKQRGFFILQLEGCPQPK